jgi:hypothetical protein
MAGLDPAIHVFDSAVKKDVDARDKPGHDGDYRPFFFRHAAKSFGVCSSVAG